MQFAQSNIRLAKLVNRRFFIPLQALRSRAWTAVSTISQVVAFAVMLLMVASSTVFAAVVTGLSADRSSYTFPGDTVTFTMSFDTGNRAWNGASFSDQAGHSFSQVSCPANTNTTNQQITCTFKYVAQASDVPNALEFIPEVTVSGLDTATYSGLLRISYAAPAPATLSISSSPNPSTINQNVTITATVTSNTGYPLSGTVNISNDDYSVYRDVSLVNGIATLTTTDLVAPSDTVYAYYNGDAYNGISPEASITHVVNAGVTLTSTPSSMTVVGQAYSQANSASGGTVPYIFSVSGGALPNGVAINSSTGQVSGTPMSGGPFSYTIRVTDSTTPTASAATQTVTGTITRLDQTITFAQPADTSIAAGTLALSASSSAGLPVRFSSNSMAVCTVSGSSVTLLSAGTCSISADQSGDASFSAAPSVTRSFAVSPTAPGAPTLGVIVVPDGAAGSPTGLATVNFIPPASSGGAPITQYEVMANPGGLTATGASSPISVSGLAFGTAYSFTVRAHNSAGPGPASASSALVTPVSGQTISFANPGGVNFGTTTTLTATATSGLTVTLSSQTTNVCEFSSGTNILAKAPGTCTVRASQAGNGAYRAAADVIQSFQILIPGGAVSIITGTLPAPTRGVAYSQTIVASGGAPPYTYRLASGNLPNGLVMTGFGTIAGTATSSGTYNFTIEVTDQASQTATRPYSFTVVQPSISFTPTSLPAATGGVAYTSTAISTSGGIAPYAYAVTTGNLPNGLTLSSTGVISGTPREAGAYPFTVTATDAFGVTGSQAYTIAVAAPAIAVTPASLNPATGGSSYSQVFGASGGSIPYSYSVSSGRLPTGLSLSTDGALSGTPTEAGSFPFAVKATDNNGFEGAMSYVMQISAPVPVVQNQVAELVAGTTGRVNLTKGASGGPFTSAAITQYPDIGQGSARIEQDGGDYILAFAAASTLNQAVTIRYTLSNSWGTSTPAEVRFEVISLPDPTLDNEVTDLVNAQISAAQRFATAQISNYRSRLEQLHDEGDRRANSFGIGIGGPRENEELAYLQHGADDPAVIELDRMAKSDQLKERQVSSTDEEPSRLALWTGGFVNFGSRDSKGIDLDHTLVGTTVGADYKFSSNVIAGIGLGYGRDVTEIGDSGTETKGQAFSAALYGSYRPMDRFFFDGLVGYSFLDFDSQRFVSDTGDIASGQRSGNQIFGSLSLSYEYRNEAFLISPYGSVDASWSRLDGYSEAGATLYNLRFDDQETTTISGIVGLRAEYSVPMSWGLLRPKTRLEYTHDFTGTSRAGMGYASFSNGFPYAFEVEPSERDYLGISLGFDAQLVNNRQVSFDYRTAFGFKGESQDHTFALKFRSRF